MQKMFNHKSDKKSHCFGLCTRSDLSSSVMFRVAQLQQNTVTTNNLLAKVIFIQPFNYDDNFNTGKTFTCTVSVTSDSHCYGSYYQ